jgi:hypothetical protein
MKMERFIEVDGLRVFKEDIEGMDKDQIITLCSFVDNERDLRFIQDFCQEEYRYIIDNLIFKVF